MKKVLMIISAAVLLAACGSKEGKETGPVDSANVSKTVAANPKEVILKKINYFDSLTKLPGVTVPDKNIAQSLINSYNEYVQFYPADSVSPKYAYLAAKVAVTVYSDQQALVLIDNAIKNYPQHPEKVQMLFWKAMVYDDRLNDKDRAKQVYEQIIKDYPGTPAEQQAKDALKWTGKTDLEMIREMEKKNGVKK